MEPTKTKRIQLKAASRLDTRRRTREGYLRADTALVRAGVMEYSGAELGLNGADADKSFGVLFGRNELFSEDTVASVRMKPVTFGHPPEAVTVDNHASLAVGHIGDDVREIDGERLGASMLLTSATAIAAVERGVEETSIGFAVELSPSKGTQDGKSYDFQLSGPIEVNHVAIVDRGRAGPAVRIFNQERQMTDEELKKLVNEAITAALPAQEKKDETQKPPKIDAAALADSIVSKLANAIAEAKEEAGKADDEDCTEDPDTEGQDVQTLAAARAELIVNASPLLPKDSDPHGMSDREIIVTALGDTVKDADKKSDDYLRGQLDLLVASRGRAADERQRVSDESASGKGTPVMTAPSNFLEMRARFRED